MAAAMSVRLYLKPGRHDSVVPAAPTPVAFPRRRARVREGTSAASGPPGSDRPCRPFPLARGDRLARVEGETGHRRRLLAAPPPSRAIRPSIGPDRMPYHTGKAPENRRRRPKTPACVPRAERSQRISACRCRRPPRSCRGRTGRAAEPGRAPSSQAHRPRRVRAAESVEPIAPQAFASGIVRDEVTSVSLKKIPERSLQRFP